jgi:hypothetical protein
MENNRNAYKIFGRTLVSEETAWNTQGKIVRHRNVCGAVQSRVGTRGGLLLTRCCTLMFGKCGEFRNQLSRCHMLEKNTETRNIRPLVALRILVLTGRSPQLIKPSNDIRGFNGVVCLLRRL